MGLVALPTTNARVAKLHAADSPYPAIILAKAGMVCLSWGNRFTSDLEPPSLFHGVVQGRSRSKCVLLSVPNFLELVPPGAHHGTAFAVCVSLFVSIILI